MILIDHWVTSVHSHKKGGVVGFNVTQFGPHKECRDELKGTQGHWLHLHWEFTYNPLPLIKEVNVTDHWSVHSVKWDLQVILYTWPVYKSSRDASSLTSLHLFTILTSLHPYIPTSLHPYILAMSASSAIPYTSCIRWLIHRTKGTTVSWPFIHFAVSKIVLHLICLCDESQVWFN